MTIDSRIKKLLREDEGFYPHQKFYVYGNPVNPKKIILFEKLSIFQAIKDKVDFPQRYYFVCSLGVPSKNCLEHIKQFKIRNLFFLGDLDPIGLWAYFTFIFGKRNFSEKDEPMLKIKFLGFRRRDFEKYLHGKNRFLIKMNNRELKILNFISDKFAIKEVRAEIKFLQKRKYKVELEAICSSTSFDKYFKKIINKRLSISEQNAATR